MTKSIRNLLALAVVALLAGTVCLAQAPGEATYKAKCLMCHGAAGTPSAGMAKMGVKPVSDPEIKKLTADAMILVVKNGKGKMKAGRGTHRRADQGRGDVLPGIEVSSPIERNVEPGP